MIDKYTNNAPVKNITPTIRLILSNFFILGLLSTFIFPKKKIFSSVDIIAIYRTINIATCLPILSPDFIDHTHLYSMLKNKIFS
jgi:hypothetical protein